MNRSKFYLWLNEGISQAIEGACDSFIVVAGGATATQVSASPKAIITSVAIGGAIYVAAYLKKYPTPAHYVPPADPAAAVPPVSPA